MTTEKIKAAEAKIKACHAAIAALDVRRLAALGELKNANEDLHGARLVRDMALPKAQIKKSEMRTGKVRLFDVVVVRKTDKSAWVREAGMDSDGDQYRIDKNGQWHPYPATRDMWGSWRELIIEGGAS